MKTFNSIFLILFIISSVACQEENASLETNGSIENNKPAVQKSAVPDGYELILQDDFEFFDQNNWSKGLTHDSDASIKMIWNKNTGGKHLLNDNYAGYVQDQNTYTVNGLLYLNNRKETIQGTDPAKTFEYSTGWINSLQKLNFNGTQQGVYLEVKAKFPKGEKVWPAIWLIDDSTNRAWPPEVDIWEYFGTFFNANWGKDQMYMRFIYGHWSDKKDHSIPINNFQHDFKASEQWHTYGYLWTNKKMSWYIDGEEVHTKTKGKEVPSNDWPNKIMCLVINNGLLNAVSEGDTVFPNSLIIDSLKLYQEK